MAEEFEATYVMDAAAIASTLNDMSSTMKALPESVASAIAEVLDRAKTLGDGGGSVAGNGTVSGANTTALGRGGQGRRANGGAGDAEGAGAFVDADKMADEFIDRVRKKTGERVVNEGGQRIVQEASGAGGKASGVIEGLNELMSSLGGNGANKSGLLKIMDSVADGFGGLAKNAEGLGAMFGQVASVAGRFAGVFGLITGGLALMGGAIDTFQTAKDVAVSQTGSADDMTLGAREFLQARSEALFSGLSDDEAESIQQRLITNRAAFGSESYNEGFRFAQSARLNYAMDVNSATDLYVRAVMRGSMTVEDLNASLEGLAKTSQETGITMTELTEQFTDTVNSLSDKYGSVGAEMATDFFTEMGLTGDQAEFASMMVQGIDLENPDGPDYQRYLGYLQQGMQSGQAAYYTAMDAKAEGRMQNQALYWQHLGSGDKSFMDYINEGDYSGLEKVLDQSTPEGQAAWTSLYQRLSKEFGADFMKKYSTPEAFIDQFRDIEAKVADTPTASMIGGEGALEIETSSNRYYNPETMSTSDMLALGGGQGLQAAYMASQAHGDRVAGGIEDFSSVQSGSKEMDALVSALVTQGYLDSESMKYMTQSELDSIVREYGQAYIDAGGSDRFSSFSDFLGKAKSEYSSAYDAGMRSNSQSEQFEVHLVLEGELGEILLEKIERAQKRKEADYGSEK